MNPSYGIILWIIIGALAGWIGSKIMGTDKAQGGLANILVGVAGAVLGGFLTRALLRDDPSNNGPIASFVVALLGSVVLIGIVRALRRR
jgi:uncharacterized membrane protein YeaQ/YmgE (transglycosylase-associated protein family)